MKSIDPVMYKPVRDVARTNLLMMRLAVGKGVIERRSEFTFD